MTTASLTRIDLSVRDAVLEELAWDSQVDASAIGVAARAGAVTLSGFIDSYAGKLAAERAAKRVRGVRAIANDIQVRLRMERPDDEIAMDVARTFGMRATLPAGVQAVVHSGHITLTGTVNSLFQRAAAEMAVHEVKGVKGIVNRIEIATTSSLRDIQRQITRALHRDADVYARGITVSVVGQTVRLTGTVGSWREREAAERAAAHATGITVDNRISVAASEVDPDDDNDPLC